MSVLYSNNGDGTFRDSTGDSGIESRGYGMGACAADYDNDGWVDLYLTNFGSNVLYRNQGDGTFGDATLGAEVGSALRRSAQLYGVPAAPLAISTTTATWICM